MLRSLALLPLLFACALRAAPEPLPDPNGSEGWANVSSKADVLALPEDTKHVHGHRMDDAALEALKRLKALQSLTLQGEYTDAGVKHLGELKTLRDLQIDFSRLTDASCAPIGKLTELEYLGLERCVKLTDRGLKDLAGLKKVTWLILHGDNWDDMGRKENQGVTDAGLRHLSGMTAMKRLDLGSLRQAGDALAELGPRMKDLQEITISSCGKLTEAGFKGLARCNSLQRVHLFSMKGLGETALRHLAALKALDYVSFQQCEGVTDAAMGALGKSKSMTTISYQGRVEFGDGALTELAKCKTLRRLGIEHMNTGSGPDMEDWGGGEELEDPDNPMPPRQPAKPAPQAKFSDAAFKALGKAEGLRELTLDRVDAVTDTALLGLLDLPLETLVLNSCVNVTDKGLQVIGKMKTLKRLSLSASGGMFLPPGMEGENAKKMRITNEGLKHLGGLENLVDLNLSGQAINDAGLEHLKPLKALRLLVVHEVRGITESGEAALREAIPEIRVERDPGEDAGPPPPD